MGKYTEEIQAMRADPDKFNYIERVAFEGRMIPAPPAGFEWYKTTVKPDEVEELNDYNDGVTPLFKAGDFILRVKKVNATT